MTRTYHSVVTPRRWRITVALTATALGATLIAPLPAEARVLRCSDRIDGRFASVTCHNPTKQSRTFRAVITCGWWPDTHGNWATVAPGQRATSSGKCGGGSGVGAVGVDER
ncbi:hypothetical protein [Marinactinospora rubrisoli]|uniref:Secreted protein n=1 Tax=Marinactinospora rubrisoli TaxID=2715399 RepID=A0ABW2KLG0_9ACTN